MPVGLGIELDMEALLSRVSDAEVQCKCLEQNAAIVGQTDHKIRSEIGRNTDHPPRNLPYSPRGGACRFNDALTIVLLSLRRTRPNTNPNTLNCVRFPLPFAARPR